MRPRAPRIEHQIVEEADSPLGRMTLRRYTSGQQTGYEIRLEGRFLMATHGVHSERAMAPLALERVRPGGREQLSVLVGGLGCGQTLAELLRQPRVSRAVVCEMSKAVVDWNRRYFPEASQRALDDPRVEVVISDLYDHLRAGTDRYDAMLLDVDNGPRYLASKRNRRLYDRQALRLCRAGLRAGGVLCIWSAIRHDGFLARMESAFDAAAEMSTEAWPERGDEPVDYLYLGVVSR